MRQEVNIASRERKLNSTGASLKEAEQSVQIREHLLPFSIYLENNVKCRFSYSAIGIDQNDTLEIFHPIFRPSFLCL